MDKFIELNRSFRELTDQEAVAFDDLELSMWPSYRNCLSWPELLSAERVVILAEAGSGKTWEMKEQVRALNARKQFAMFSDLIKLCDDAPADIDPLFNQPSFEGWKRNSIETGWFFLDSVDEMKLTKRKLSAALERMARLLDGHLQRACIILSSRPSDWTWQIDRNCLLEYLPFAKADAIHTPSKLLRPHDFHSPANSITSYIAGGVSPEAAQKIKIVRLLPLTKQQIGDFARATGTKNIDQFMAEIGRRDDWNFVNRPLDLTALINDWNATGAIGTRSQQRGNHIRRNLRDDPERIYNDELIYEKAQAGAENIALAMSMGKFKHILVPERVPQSGGAGASIDAREILQDWGDGGRALLRRGIFDPGTYGAVRFHHRSVQEYLAAQCLWRLLNAGMARRELHTLLFATTYGADVIIPSMRPIAAWLALWDSPVRAEIIRREPEVLLAEGDPETLPLADRENLLRSFATLYGTGAWRGIGAPVQEIRRLADPALAPVVRDLWGECPQNEDLRTLLLELIWCGRMEACVDIAAFAAFNTDFAGSDRLVALRALIDCQKIEAVEAIVDTLVRDVAAWPARTAPPLASILFPKFLNIDQLLLLVERTPELDTSFSRFGFELEQIAKELEPGSALAEQFRNGLADLIWAHRPAQQEFWNLNSGFHKLTEALSIICDRQISLHPDVGPEALIRCCIIAARFGGGNSNKPLQRLRSSLASRPDWRATIFWTDLAMMNEILPERDAWHQYYQCQRESLVNPLTEADIHWIESALVAGAEVGQRAVAFEVWTGVWLSRGMILADLQRLQDLIADDGNFVERVSKLRAPPPVNPLDEQLQREAAQYSAQAAARNAAIEEAWREWYSKLKTEAEYFFGPEKLESTLCYMCRWLQMSREESNRFNVWDRDVISGAFGQSITERVIHGGKEFWRRTEPLPQSQRPESEWNTVPGTWIFGLFCLSAEASMPGWTLGLTEEDARTACYFAMVEVTGFAPFIDDLASAFPALVEQVIGVELSAQLERIDRDHFLPVLRSLGNASAAVQKLFVRRLLQALPRIQNFGECRNWAIISNHLHFMLGLLAKICDGDQRRGLAELCRDRFEEDPDSPLALQWIQGLFRLNAIEGTTILANVLNSGRNVHSNDLAAKILVALFGEHDSIGLDIENPVQRAEALGALIRIAYRAIRPCEDQEHEGIFTPNFRDAAERARSFLLGALIDTVGARAFAELNELADLPEFVDLRDRLGFLARQRAAKDSEPTPRKPADILKLLRQHELPPNDRDSMFQIMMGRLEDIADYLANGDFSDRDILRGIKQEKEMQRSLAQKLHLMSKGAYSVTREPEVVDNKRNDIRLTAAGGQVSAVIEIKISDKSWTLAALEQALSDQLVGQYMRDTSCRAGCLLLTYHGEKKYWKKDGGDTRLNFYELVLHLQQLARKIVEERNCDICLSVFGIDLQTPH